MKFIVFGLGHFGAALSLKLVKLGHEVIGVDNNMDLVDKYKDDISHTLQLDASNRDAIEMLPLKDTDAIVVGIGENEGVNIMTTALLKEIGVNRLICRVTSKLQKTILEAMNITEFIEPEMDSAERLAYRLDLKSVKDSLRVTDDYHILKVMVHEKCAQKTVEELELIKKYNLKLITILRTQTTKNVFGTLKDESKVLKDITPGTHIKEKDILVLYGSNDDLEKFVKETL